MKRISRVSLTLIAFLDLLICVLLMAQTAHPDSSLVGSMHLLAASISVLIWILSPRPVIYYLCFLGLCATLIALFTSPRWFLEGTSIMNLPLSSLHFILIAGGCWWSALSTKYFSAPS